MAILHVTPIYLDYNATTPILPDVLEAMLPFLSEAFGNPSSGHVFGLRAKEAVEAARGEVAASIGCEPVEVVFTSGGTEANNLAIFGAAAALGRSRRPGTIVTSAVEHAATRAPCERLAASGWRLHVGAVDADGVLDLEDVERALDPLPREEPILVSVMHANNEVGALQPIRELSRLGRARGAVVHTDAAQSVGKVAVDVNDLGVDLLSIAGHKLYAPKGVGALYVRKGTDLDPHALGAGHERGLRPGTENVASIVGLGRACTIAARDRSAVSRRLASLRDLFWRRLHDGVPRARVNGPAEGGLPNTLSVRFEGTRGSVVLANAPEVAASTGSACHDGNESPSAVLRAMRLGNDEALSTVRLTLGRGTTEEDVERAAASLIRAYKTALMR